MDVIDAIHSRRSVRSYQSKLVDRELIESVIWDAAQAPPPFSGQVPWTFNVIEGAERIAALGTRHGPRPRNAAGCVEPAVA
jgi:nitroreductase